MFLKQEQSRNNPGIYKIYSKNFVKKLFSDFVWQN